MLGAHRNAMGTFHHDQTPSHGGQEGLVQVIEETSNVASLEKNWKVRLPQLWWVRLFSLGAKYAASAIKKRKNMKRCGHGWFSGSRDRNEESWNGTKKH